MSDLFAVARGEQPADLLLLNARIVNTLSGEIEEGNVAVAGEQIAGIGGYRNAAEVINLGGRYLVPGLINGHIHPESSMLHPARYAEAVVPRGVSGIVTDLHETGLTGARWMLDVWRRLPLDVYFMVPSCVPATHLETAGAEVTAEDIAEALTWEGSIGLGEVMNFPGVIHADGMVHGKLAMAAGRVVDGHAPEVSGMDLNAYIAAGIDSDHESTSLPEALEKLRRGMYLMIREGSSEKNLADLLYLVTDHTWPRCLFVVDDRSASDLLRDGDIDAVVRKAIALGLDPIRAVQLATINPARRFGLRGIGAIAPGYFANFCVMEDLTEFSAGDVYHRGRRVASDGEPHFDSPPPDDNEEHVKGTMRVKPFTVEDLRIPAEQADRPIIEIIPDQIVTGRSEDTPTVDGDSVIADPGRDLAKLVVVERHRATGNIGRAIIRGTGLKRGALASSIGHDSHNIIAVGLNDHDLHLAVTEVERLGGGLVAVADGKVLGALPLPIAGLLSDEPLNKVVEQHEALKTIAAELGSTMPHPFATLSFLALPVIPALKLTDKGLVDVNAFRLID